MVEGTSSPVWCMYCSACVVYVLFCMCGACTVLCVWCMYCSMCVVYVLFCVCGVCTVLYVWCMYCSMCVVYVLFYVCGVCTVPCVVSKYYPMWSMYCSACVVQVRTLLWCQCRSALFMRCCLWSISRPHFYICVYSCQLRIYFTISIACHFPFLSLTSTHNDFQFLNLYQIRFWQRECYYQASSV